MNEIIIAIYKKNGFSVVNLKGACWRLIWVGLVMGVIIYFPLFMMIDLMWIGLTDRDRFVMARLCNSDMACSDPFFHSDIIRLIYVISLVVASIKMARKKSGKFFSINGQVN